MQRASVVAWSDERHVEETRARYRAKRDVLIPAIEAKGWEIVASEATMYLWVGRPPTPARALLERGVIVSPGEILRAERRGLRPVRARADARRVQARSGDTRGACEHRRDDRRPSTGARSASPRRSTASGASTRTRRRRSSTTSALRKIEPIEVGPYEYIDKIPLKRDYAELGVRVVPPATARYGSFLSPGVVMMPSYVNIGAWVGAEHDDRHVGDGRLVRADRRRRPSRRRRRHRRRARAAAGAPRDRRGRGVHRLALHPHRGRASSASARCSRRTSR